LNSTLPVRYKIPGSNCKSLRRRTLHQITTGRHAAGANPGQRLASGDDRESAILGTLSGGAYTVIIRGVNSTISLALIEVYNLQ
jgi:hypothetical protein